MLIGWQVDLWNTGSRRWATGPSALNQSPRSFLGLLREVQLICLGADTVIHIPPLLAHHFLVSKYEETLNKSSSNYFCLVSMSAAFLFETVYFYLFYIIRYKVHREKFTHTQTTSQFGELSQTPLYPSSSSRSKTLPEIPLCAFPLTTSTFSGKSHRRLDFQPCSLPLPVFKFYVNGVLQHLFFWVWQLSFIQHCICESQALAASNCDIFLPVTLSFPLQEYTNFFYPFYCWWHLDCS